MLVREILNRIIWDPKEDPNEYTVTYIHRGVEGNTKVITVNLIREVAKGSFKYIDPEGHDTLIPFHRIVEIKNIVKDEIAYKKHNRK